MATVREWLRDWRAIADLVPAGEYGQIFDRRDRQNFEVLLVSAYDEEVDGERAFVTTPSRQFDDKVSLYSGRTRDLGVMRVITVRGIPRYVLEPGADAVDWSAGVEEVSVADLTRAVREGEVGRRVARLVAGREKLTNERLRGRVQALREQLEDAEVEVAVARGELATRERRLARR